MPRNYLRAKQNKDYYLSSAGQRGGRGIASLNPISRGNRTRHDRWLIARRYFGASPVCLNSLFICREGGLVSSVLHPPILCYAARVERPFTAVAHCAAELRKSHALVKKLFIS